MSEEINRFVYAETLKILEHGKTVAILGGDHSVPLGAYQAAAQKFGNFGILHFDAHADLRSAYEGFTHSHASIMNNALEGIPEIEKLVQVGIRDFCEEEVNYAKSQGQRVEQFFDLDIARNKAHGVSWKTICDEILMGLPQNVWISFDIDGLDPRFCPHTGTPVPGGIDFNEAILLIESVVRSGRTIIGFDLVEVAPGPKGDEWDANVGARLMYKMAGWTLKSLSN